ncbi:type II secretion system F family protein [Micromonospora zhanjiangensis]
MTVYLPDGTVLGTPAARTPAVELAARAGRSLTVTGPDGNEIVVAVTGRPEGTAVIRTVVSRAELTRGVDRSWLVLGTLGVALLLVGLLVAVAVPGTPWLFTVGRAEKRAIARIEAVGEWTRRLKDVSSTGQGLQQAIIGTVATAPEEIDEEVRLLAARLQAGWLGRPALLAFAEDIADPVCDQVVAALLLHLTDRGERLGDVLAAISAGAAAEVATRREVEAKRTQPRFAVRFLTAMTLLVLAYGLVNPTYMEPYRTPVGQLVMVGLGAAIVALLVWVRAMSQPPRPARFLAAPDPEEMIA